MPRYHQATSALFAERTGFPLAIVAKPLDEGVRRGLVDPDPARIVATERGRRFLNRTLQLFLPDDPPPRGATVAPVTLARASPP